MAETTDNQAPMAQDWDDSALMTSWEDALAEYKKYHSMAAKGEKVDPDALISETSKPASSLPNGGPKPQAAASTVPPNFVATPAPAATDSSASAMPAAPPNMPQVLPGGITQNENLKNIMSAWYYAGYYTGFHDGQEQAWTDIQGHGQG